ncbi:hypothetical protein AB0C34_15385 [Nocardia sp. NPDC049220]|uniref:hypothetical protein n=1 Tax=Nocardia sp. NPDC049220 TaxID=3155273 RepID=UPI0033E9E0DF
MLLGETPIRWRYVLNGTVRTRGLRISVSSAEEVIVIENPSVSNADDLERDRVIWPDPSPLSAWWADVMAHRVSRTESTTDPIRN